MRSILVTTQEIKQQDATQALKSALINLTVNLILIVRGAGKQHYILEHLRDLMVAYTNWAETHRRESHPTLCNDLLRFEEAGLAGEPDDHAEATFADFAICRQALQIVASTLLKQQRQRDNALIELHALLDMELERREDRRRPPPLA